MCVYLLGDFVRRRRRGRPCDNQFGQIYHWKWAMPVRDAFSNRLLTLSYNRAAYSKSFTRPLFSIPWIRNVSAYQCPIIRHFTGPDVPVSSSPICFSFAKRQINLMKLVPGPRKFLSLRACYVFFIIIDVEYQLFWRDHVFQHCEIVLALCCTSQWSSASTH